MKGMDIWVAAAVFSLGWSMIWSLFTLGAGMGRSRS